MTNNSKKYANINEQNVRLNKNEVFYKEFLCLIQNKYKCQKMFDM